MYSVLYSTWYSRPENYNRGPNNHLPNTAQTWTTHTVTLPVTYTHTEHVFNPDMNDTYCDTTSHIHPDINDPYCDTTSHIHPHRTLNDPYCDTTSHIHPHGTQLRCERPIRWHYQSHTPTRNTSLRIWYSTPAMICYVAECVFYMVRIDICFLYFSMLVCNWIVCACERVCGRIYWYIS
jgi:hypothetical protein